MIFIGIKNRACEKTKLPLKTHDLRFHSAVVAAERNRRISPERGRGQSAVSFGGFVTADQTAESDPRCLNASGLIGGFYSAARPPIETADSPKKGETKEKPRAFSMCGLRVKPSTISCTRGRFRTYSGNELHHT